MAPVSASSGRGFRRASVRRGRRAFTLVYAVIIMTLMAGFVSLGVDWAHVQLTKTELQQAADSAARGAAVQLSNGVTATQNAAVLWGGYNTADGTSVVILPASDIDFGTWDPAARTFTVLTGAARSSANSVRVYARRQAARGTAVNLTFGHVIGRDTCDCNASAIAYYKPGSGNYGLVGMTAATLKTGTVTTDSYDASAGAYSAGTATAYGNVAGNGSITLGPGTSVTVNQDLYMQAGQTLSTSGSVSYGSRKAVSPALVFPVPSAGSYATTNSNGSLGLPPSGATASFSSGSFTAPGGTYYLDSLNLSGGTIGFTGPVTIYMNGPFTISGGSMTAYNNLPGNLVIKTIKASTVSVSGTTTFYADIQAPSSTVTMGGVTTFCGRLIGGTLTITGTSAVHVDTSLPAISGASTNTAAGASVQTVR